MNKSRSPLEIARGTPSETGYVTFNNQNRQEVISKNSDVANLAGIQRSSAYLWRDYSGLAPNVSGRPGLTKQDYSFFRPNETVPHDYKKIMMACDFYYYTVGLIRNIVDLMSDFTSQGIRLSHPNARIQEFYRNWFEKVHGLQVSERIASYLIRMGQAPIRVQTGIMKKKDKDALYKSSAKIKDKEKIRVKTATAEFVMEKNEIPWKYNFLHPAQINMIGGPIAEWSGKPRYSLMLSNQIRQIIMAPRTPEEKVAVANIPEDIKRAARENLPWPLPEGKTLVYHYKKDDWMPWAFPMIYSVMDDIIMLEKLRLADLTALDGAISNIRLFVLGDLANGVAATPAATAKFSEILESHVGGGTLDIVWTGPIVMHESKSEVYKFLGEEKYKPALNAIYSGLGIPPTLTGTGEPGGTTNNYISLKTLIERLQYLRNILYDFWTTQCIAVQKSMGFRFPATVEFESSDLSDETNEKSLWIQLYDRNLVSDELIRRKFGNDPELERIRIRKETKSKMDGSDPPKLGPFKAIEEDLKKIALQGGTVTPSQIGLNLADSNPDEQTPLDIKHEQALKLQKAKPPGMGGGNSNLSKPKGIPQQGRPRTSTDKTKRKTKTFKPKIKAALAVWVNNCQEYIADNLSEGFLKQFDKSNMRQLSTEQAALIENVKFGILLNIEPMTKMSKETLQAALEQKVYNDMEYLTGELKKIFVNNFNKEITLPELRELQKAYYIQTLESNNEHD